MKYTLNFVCMVAGAIAAGACIPGGHFFFVFFNLAAAVFNGALWYQANFCKP